MDANKLKQMNTIFDMMMDRLEIPHKKGDSRKITSEHEAQVLLIAKLNDMFAVFSSPIVGLSDEKVLETVRAYCDTFQLMISELRNKNDKS